jgi:hypothetical protein
MVSREEWVKRLKPYWEEYKKAEIEFFKKVNEIENRMRKEQKNKNLELAYPRLMGGIELYFGIGFEADFKAHPPGLIHDSDFDEA